MTDEELALATAALEPQVNPLFADGETKALWSIAISLKRIADLLSDGTLPTAISAAAKHTQEPT